MRTMRGPIAKKGSFSFLQLLTIVVALLFWEFFARLSPGQIAPTPAASFLAVWELLRSGLLASDWLASVERVAVGYASAAVLGIAVGIVFGLAPAFERMFTPVFEILRPIPPIAWIPLSIIIFGLGDGSSYFIIFLGAFYPILTNTA